MNYQQACDAGMFLASEFHIERDVHYPNGMGGEPQFRERFVTEWREVEAK